MDLLVRNAKLREREKLVDIGISEGKIVEICEKTKTKNAWDVIRTLIYLENMLILKKNLNL